METTTAAGTPADAGTGSDSDSDDVARPAPRGAGEFADFAVAQTPALLRLAHALTGNPHDAWDLVQETLARMGERWGRSRFEEPAAYARTVMTRLNIDRIRRLRRELPLLRQPDAPPAVELVGTVDAWLVEALATLSARQRTVLALRYVEDLDVRGIAVRMRCSDGTVKSLLSRGTARLQEHARTHGHASDPVPDPVPAPTSTQEER
ncbi:MAG: sigma-70 family RNA polymerase sigma factor [Nocardioides sp.]